VKSVHPYLESPYPVVLAHQGHSQQAPSNTLPAFELALQCGADILETDLHWTKDGVLVFCHDETVDRTSNGRGAIKDFTLAELKRLDFGYQFTTDAGQSYPFRGQGIEILTLQEALTAFPNVRFNIDVKPNRPLSLQQLVRQIYDFGAESRVLLASFHHHVLRTIRTMTRRIATSASIRECTCFFSRTWTGRNAFPALPYVALQVPMDFYGFPVVTQKFVDTAHQAGLQVHVWTIDDGDIMSRLLSMGVDGIVTNRPDVGVAVRRRFLQERTA
jgi:glycerophosphoryl diester phosphodiesterase